MKKKFLSDEGPTLRDVLLFVSAVHQPFYISLYFLTATSDHVVLDKCGAYISKSKSVPDRLMIKYSQEYSI